LALLSSTEPQNVREACKDECWVKAMDEELEQIKKNNTWELVPRPKDRNVIGTKWIFKNKLNENGKLLETKPDWFVKGMLNKKESTLKKCLLPLLDLRPSKCSLLSLPFRNSKYFKWT